MKWWQIVGSILACLVALYFVFRDEDDNHLVTTQKVSKYKIICLDGHQYYSYTSSYKSTLAPIFNDSGVPRKCRSK